MEEAVQDSSNMEQEVNEVEQQDDGDAVEELTNWLSDEYLYLDPKRGDIRMGTILRMEPNEKKPEEILMDIGAKVTGVVQSRDLERLSEEVIDSLKIGSEHLVYVLKPDQDGVAVVSINMALSMQDWQRAREAMEEDEIFEEEVTGFNKGGLLVQYGQVQGFVPASQVISVRRGSRGEDYQESLKAMVGKKIPLKVIEVDHRRRRLILSERQARREWQQSQKEDFLNELAEGQIRKGIVSSFCDFGAFVNLGPMDGLIHISELSWRRVNDPSEVLKLNQEVKVYVLSVDRERERIALSLKRLQQDPWEEAAGNYKPGQVVECVITNVVRFGAFARIEPGIEGLVHISELDDAAVRSPEDIVQVGERLLLRVLRVDMERHRIALSLRQVTAEDRAAWYLAPENALVDEEDEDEDDQAQEAAPVGDADYDDDDGYDDDYDDDADDDDDDDYDDDYDYDDYEDEDYDEDEDD